MLSGIKEYFVETLTPCRYKYSLPSAYSRVYKIYINGYTLKVYLFIVKYNFLSRDFFLNEFENFFSNLISKSRFNLFIEIYSKVK